MSKYLVVSRDASGEWYKRAQSFLAENHSKPLELVISDYNTANDPFLRAVSALTENTGHTVEIDAKVDIFVIAAGIDDPSAELMSQCQCQCGSSYSCGG